MCTKKPDNIWDLFDEEEEIITPILNNLPSYVSIHGGLLKIPKVY